MPNLQHLPSAAWVSLNNISKTEASHPKYTLPTAPVLSCLRFHPLHSAYLMNFWGLVFPWHLQCSQERTSSESSSSFCPLILEKSDRKLTHILVTRDWCQPQHSLHERQPPPLALSNFLSSSWEPKTPSFRN